jgi:hypothetical protein
VTDTDDLMQRWGAAFLGLPPGTPVKFYDESVTGAGGCDTCGYGVPVGYRLEVYTVGGPYVSREYEGGFVSILEELARLDKETGS